MTHEVDRQLFLAGSWPDIRERLDAAVDLHHGDWKSPEVVLVEKAERKALLGAAFHFEPRIRDLAQGGQDRGHLGNRHDAERRAVFRELVPEEPHLLARAA